MAMGGLRTHFHLHAVTHCTEGVGWILNSLRRYASHQFQTPKLSHPLGVWWTPVTDSTNEFTHRYGHQHGGNYRSSNCRTPSQSGPNGSRAPIPSAPAAAAPQATITSLFFGINPRSGSPPVHILWRSVAVCTTPSTSVTRSSDGITHRARQRAGPRPRPQHHSGCFT